MDAISHDHHNKPYDPQYTHIFMLSRIILSQVQETCAHFNIGPCFLTLSQECEISYSDRWLSGVPNIGALIEGPIPERTISSWVRYARFRLGSQLYPLTRSHSTNADWGLARSCRFLKAHNEYASNTLFTLNTNGCPHEFNQA